ncbi:c2H2-type domain-containing protein [Trichonephila clavipes]|nr:c2H2-type domain-containing protein [Trichonephila clavipes]
MAEAGASEFSFLNSCPFCDQKVGDDVGFRKHLLDIHSIGVKQICNKAGRSIELVPVTYNTIEGKFIIVKGKLRLLKGLLEKNFSLYVEHFKHWIHCDITRLEFDNNVRTFFTRDTIMYHHDFIAMYLKEIQVLSKPFRKFFFSNSTSTPILPAYLNFPSKASICSAFPSTYSNPVVKPPLSAQLNLTTISSHLNLASKPSTSNNSYAVSKPSTFNNSFAAPKVSTSNHSYVASKPPVSNHLCSASKPSTSVNSNTGSKSSSSTNSNAGSKSSTSTNSNAGSKSSTSANSNAGSKSSTSTHSNAGSKSSSTNSNAGSKSSTSTHSNAGSKSSTSTHSNAGSKSSTSTNSNAGSKSSTSTNSNAGSKSSTSNHLYATASKPSTSNQSYSSAKPSTSNNSYSATKPSTSARISPASKLVPPSHLNLATKEKSADSNLKKNSQLTNEGINILNATFMSSAAGRQASDDTPLKNSETLYALSIVSSWENECVDMQKKEFSRRIIKNIFDHIEQRRKSIRVRPDNTIYDTRKTDSKYVNPNDQPKYAGDVTLPEILDTLLVIFANY